MHSCPKVIVSDQLQKGSFHNQIFDAFEELVGFKHGMTSAYTTLSPVD